MNSYLEQYCQQLDQEFSKIIETTEQIIEYNQLVDEINSDVQLKELVNEQRKLQQELMNLRAIKQEQFSDLWSEKLKVIDNKLQSDERLNKLRRLNYKIDLEREIISDELQEWKENYVFKN